MAEHFRMVIESADRVGVTLDVLQVIYRFKLNIVSMDVSPELIHLKLSGFAPQLYSQLVEQLMDVQGVRKVAEVEALPSEQREQQLAAILHTVSEGIIAVDASGVITLLNPAAERVLISSASSALGRPIQEVLSDEVPILQALATGKGYDHQEMMINTPRGRSHYITTGRVIKNEQGQITGAVAAMKDMNQVRELVYSITRPSMITFGDIVGRSKVIQQVISLAKTVARTDSTVMLRGESGTGKELFARAIHMASPRRNRPFVPVNCAALPDTLLESELFGYEQGAFTGAQRGGKQGLFEFVHRGTLFLDEIGELPRHLQAKLLRVLQEGKVRRVGGQEEIPVDVRLVTATSRNLEEMVRRGDFREDLYYRLNVIPLFLPPLRGRKEDIPLLVENLIAKLNSRLGTRVEGVSEAAMQKLLGHNWPGNIRELVNVVERGINLAGGATVLEPVHLALHTMEMYPGGWLATVPTVQWGSAVQTHQAVPVEGVIRPAFGQVGDVQSEDRPSCQPIHPAAPAGVPGSLDLPGPTGTPVTRRTTPSGEKDGAGTATGISLAAAVARTEAEMLAEALAKHHSVRQAARALGLSHTAVLQKMRKYGLTRSK